MAREIYDEVLEAQALAPKAYTATTNGGSVDCAGFESAMVLVEVGTVTDGSHAIALQDSPDGTTFTNVDPSLILGAQPTLTATSSNSVAAFAYIGVQRFLRVVSAVTGATTGGVYSASIIRGHSRHMSTRTVQP